MPSPNSQRAPRARSPSPTRQPPCSRPLAPIQRPPKKRPEVFMHSDVTSPSAPPVPAPPEKSCPSSLTRPTRSEASIPCQRPPRTEAPAPGLIIPPSPLVSTWADFPCSLQRPPRIKAPFPMDRTCVAEPAVVMQRPRNTEPSLPLQRPPRIKLTAPHGESLASLQIPVKAVPLVQRPPRTNPPCPTMRTDAPERPGHKEASAPIVSDACAAKSTVGHKKGGSADTSLEKSDRTDASDPDTDHKKASPGVQTPVKDLEAAGEASRSVEASPSEDASVVQQSRQPDEKQWRDLSESDDTEDDIGLYITLEDQDYEDGGQKKKKGKISLKRKREDSQAGVEATVSRDLENSLDRSLDDRAKQHNLTAVNVRNILHEVITNEHVVAMMKAAITETTELPIFEPKMTRSKLKEVVEKGVVIPTWNLSPIKKVGQPKVPQFVDIPLEEEDSSDEEYRPDEEDEDETAEESLLESDVESTASSPRGHKRLRVHHLSEPTEEEEAAEGVEGHQTEKVSPESTMHVDTDVALMGPPPPPTKIEYTQDSMFMEVLHAVDEELNSSMVCMDSYQTIEDSLIAFRTRSKRPLKGVRIGQLEAKLKAPDFTPDMYDPNTADDEDWKMWLQSLMQDDMENEDEADDDDDPEYNILEDMDEPDTEDLRNDRAVRITKKEVSELMEELFETFQDELGYSNFEEEELEDDDSNEDPTCKLYAGEPEDEDSQIEAVNNFNTPQAIRFEEPLANILTEQHRVVKAQLQFMRMKKSVLKSSAQDDKVSHAYQAKSATVFVLDAGQRIRLQQQIEQHVQLLSQVHLLTFRNPLLSSEADTTRMFLVELSNFAENSALVHHTEKPDFQSAFQASNLKDAIELLPKVHSHVPESYKQPAPRKNVNEIPSLPSDIAWILATQPVFMYPELLPVCGLKARGPRDRVFFSKAEDSLLALGLKHFEGTEFTKALISKYLVPAKTYQQLNARMKNLTMIKSPDNILKYYRKTKSLPATVKCCDVIQAYDSKPPLEREKHRLPYWLKASLTNIEAETEKLEKDAQISGKGRPGHKYPLLMPPELKLALKPLPTRYYYKAWKHRRPALQPLLIRPNSSPIKSAFKQPSVLQPVPITILGGMPSFLQSPTLVQGFVGLSPINSLSGEVRSSHVPAVTQPAVASPIPILQPKTTLPLTSQRVRKPRRKSLPKTTYFRSTPLIQPAPVIFTVPSGAIKLVNLDTSCGVIQPVGARQAIPVTTVLLNPPSAPVNQPLVTPSFNQAIYDVTSVIHGDRSGLVLGAGATCTVKQEEEDLKPIVEPACQEQEYDYISVIIKEDEGSAEDGETNPGEQGAGEEERTSAISGERSEVEGCSFDSGNRPPSSESRPPQGGSCPAGLGFSSLSSNDVKDDLEFQSNCMQVSQAVRIRSPEIKEEDEVGVSESMGTQFVRNMSPGTGEHPAELQHSDKPGQLQSLKEEEVKEEDTDESVANTFGSSRSQLLNAITSTLPDSDCPTEPVDIALPDHPAESVDIVQPDRPAEPVDIALPDRPVEPVDIVLPDRPAEPVDIAQPDRPAEPVDIAHPDRPAESVDIAQPDRPAEPVDIAQPDRPAEPVDIAQPDRPAEPVDIAQADRPAEPVDIAQADRPAESVDIAQPGRPAEPVDIAQADRPAEPVDIAQPDRPAEPADIAQPGRPAEPVDIAQPDRPAEPVDIAQPGRPAEPVDNAQPDRPAEHAWPDQPAEPDQPAKPAGVAESCHPAEPLDLTTERPADPEDVQDADSEKTHHQRHMLEEREKESKGSQTQDADGQGNVAQNTPPSANGDVDMCSPTETPHDPSSPLGQQEEGNEKDIPEEEEEEDFDDLTQDEDEEEMSSASEESVLSVPELQETMEKLTWLASERRLSQEGDSEENSQEENSEPEEEEEEEVEGTDSSVRKEEEMTDEVTAESTTPAPSSPHVPSPVPMENVAAPAGEGPKGGSKGRTTIKARSRRGRPRTSKDASKLLHLYDENILVKDPLREQKDMAFAQEYLNRVRVSLQAIPGRYEQFLHLIYQFETNKHTRTAVDLYENLRGLLCDWPQLLKDFAAFLLPEQALECGLFQEHQAFEKSRKFLRQLEICFLENPAQHQKIMKLLQSFADCSLEEISKLKAQMWQLLKGHNHLQEEFSLFFDQLRPPSSRMGEFEVLNWTEDKEYKFDGFEEVSLPDVEDDEEVGKVHPPQRSKRKKEVHQGQDSDWVDGGKDCPCSCHEAGGGEQRVKRCKRRMCNHCNTKACENRVYRSRETPEVASGGPQGALRNGPPVKETGNCEGRLSFPKGTAAADRLAAGGKGANVTRGSVTTDYTVNTSKSRTASQNRSAALADSADSHAQKPQARDRPGLSQRSGRKSSTAKGPDPKLQSQKAVQSLSHQPYSPPLPPASSSITTAAAGEDRQSLVACVPSISTPKIIDSVPAMDSETQEKKQAPVQQITKCSEKEEQTLTVCAKNITVSSSGEKVILWTREADRVILTMCQETGAQDETFAAISLRLGNKSPEEVCQRFRELITLFQAVCATSSDEEEEATEQTSDLED